MRASTLECVTSRIEQQLIDISHQITSLQKDIQQSAEQLDAVADMADDANVRALVSETESLAQEAHDMAVAKERLEKVIASMKQEISDLRARQDQLLEMLSSAEE